MSKKARKDLLRKKRAIVPSAFNAKAKEEAPASFVPSDLLPQFVAAVKRAMALRSAAILLSMRKYWLGSNACYIPDTRVQLAPTITPGGASPALTRINT